MPAPPPTHIQTYNEALAGTFHLTTIPLKVVSQVMSPWTR